MKAKYLLFAMLIACSCSSFAQNKLFEKFAEMDGVTSVNVSKAMLQMMGGLQMDGVNIGSVTNKLELLQVLTSVQPSSAKIMRAETAYISKSKEYESLMEVKDGDSRTSFYVRKQGDKIKELIMLVDEKKENTFVIIRIVGDLTLKDIQSIANGSKLK